jgi:hypothetical protein
MIGIFILISTHMHCAACCFLFPVRPYHFGLTRHTSPVDFSNPNSSHFPIPKPRRSCPFSQCPRLLDFFSHPINLTSLHPL